MDVFTKLNAPLVLVVVDIPSFFSFTSAPDTTAFVLLFLTTPERFTDVAWTVVRVKHSSGKK
jgi:hypothetical protein